MIRPIKSEFLKFFTTRLWWGMAIGIFLAGAAMAAFFGFFLTMEVPATNGEATPGMGMPMGDATQIANSVYTGGISVGYLLLLTIGVLQIGSEYRHKTISATFLSTPKRMQAMLAKVVALLGLGVIYGIISLLGSVIVGAITLNLRGHDAFPSTEIFRALALSLLVLGLWALIGLGVGILIKNQIAALLVAIGVAWIIEPLVSVGLQFWEFGREHIVQFLPSQATNAIVSGVQAPGQNVLDWWAAALVLGAYAILLSGFGIWRTLREDVS